MSGRRIYLKLTRKLAQLLNPALCLNCGIPVQQYENICTHCFEQFELLDNACQLCGQPHKTGSDTCAACLLKPPRWQHMIAPLVYRDTLRKLIHHYKFDEQLHIPHALLNHMGHYYANRPVEALIPVPLHYTRLLERGFNQSLEIATQLSKRLNIPVDNTSLKRIKATEFQFGLSLNKRQKNLVKAFEFNPTQPYQSVAIIDDIITTGSTMSEICKLLKRQGVQHIEVWSLARALKND